MANRIHISTVRKILASPEPVTLTVCTAKGEVQTYRRCVGLKADHYSGTRRVKLLDSGEIRRIRDSLILALNDMEVLI